MSEAKKGEKSKAVSPGAGAPGAGAPGAEAPGAEAPFVKVKLLAPHTHEGIRYEKDAEITVRKRQVKQLQEWGVVK